MKRKTKIIISIISLIAIVILYFVIEMKNFANGVINDAKKKKDLKSQKLTDSTSLIVKDTTKPQ